MSFGLKYGGPTAFRGDLKWVNLPLRARELGWNGRDPLHYHDSNGNLLGGFVPALAS